MGFTKALSAEVAPYNVRVNAVAPGYINTDMMGVLDHDTLNYVRDRINLRRLGTVEDCAKVIEFLATELSEYRVPACSQKGPSSTPARATS